MTRFNSFAGRSRGLMLLAFAACSALLTVSAAQERPNILVIIGDDIQFEN